MDRRRRRACPRRRCHRIAARRRRRRDRATSASRRRAPTPWTASTSCTTTSPRCRWPRTLRCCARSTSTARRCCSTHARHAGVGKVVHTSSSAVFGIPESNPVLPTTVPSPLEAVRRGEARRRVGVPACRVDGLGRHDRPSAHDPRPRPAGDLRHPVRLDRRRRRSRSCSATARTATSSCTPTISLRCASRPASRPGRRCSTPGPTASARCARRSSTSARHAGTGSRVRSLPARPAALAMRATAQARPRPVRAIPLADVLEVDVVRHRPRTRRAGLDNRVGRTTRCSPRATTGSSPTERWRWPASRGRTTDDRPAPRCSRCSSASPHRLGFRERGSGDSAPAVASWGYC